MITFEILKFSFQDSDSLRERMVTIENQLKKLQQCLSSTGGSTDRNSLMGGMASGVSLPTLTGISSSTGNGNSASENGNGSAEVICIREAETSELQDTSTVAANVITDKTMLNRQKTDQDHCTEDDNNSTTDDNS